MHELSIARALLRLAEQHRPAGCAIDALRVQVGPLQAIDEGAMQFAWLAATRNTDLADAQLELEMLPWQLRCPRCGRQWEALSLAAPCQCGSEQGVPVGGDELVLESLEATQPRDGDNVTDMAAD